MELGLTGAIFRGRDVQVPSALLRDGNVRRRRRAWRDDVAVHVRRRYRRPDGLDSCSVADREEGSYAGAGGWNHCTWGHPRRERQLRGPLTGGDQSVVVAGVPSEIRPESDLAERRSRATPTMMRSRRRSPSRARRPAKLRRPAGAYSIKVALALRDDVEGNPVSYRLRVATARGIELARRFGTATTGAVSMTLRIRPPDGARLVRLQLTGVDPVGNAVSVRRALSLPR